jgi:hypothetical protein
MVRAVQRVRDRRLRTDIGNVAALDDVVAAVNPTERAKGKKIIRVRPQGRGDNGDPRYVITGVDEDCY